MLNQKKVEIFLAKFHKSLAKQFLEVAIICRNVGPIHSYNGCRNVLPKDVVLLQKKIIYPSQTMQKVIFYSFLPKVKKNFLFVKYDSDDEKNISYNQR
jgi:hypothetical protein